MPIGIFSWVHTGSILAIIYESMNILFRMLCRIQQLLKQSIVVIIVLEFGFSFGKSWIFFKRHPHNWVFCVFQCRKSYDRDEKISLLKPYDLKWVDLPKTINWLWIIKAKKNKFILCWIFHKWPNSWCRYKMMIRDFNHF